MNNLLNRDELVRRILQSSVTSCLASLGKTHTPALTIITLMREVVPAACQQALGDILTGVSVGGNLHDLPTFTATFSDGTTHYAFKPGSAGDIVIQRAFHPAGGLKIVNQR